MTLDSSLNRASRSRSRTAKTADYTSTDTKLTIYDESFFDQEINRDDVYTVKHGLKEVIFGPESKEAIPMWVADMDLPCATEICSALRRRTEHPTFGYTYQPSEIWQAAAQWLKQEHSWSVQTDDFVFASGVVTAAAANVWAFTAPGDSILLMTPLYEPLQKVVEGAGRHLVKHDLRLLEGRYVLERDRLADDLRGCRMMIFCNPHNPGGRVWEVSELRMVAELCKEQGVMIVSDEIWADWALFGHRHRPIALEVSEGQQLVTLMAPTKTWNLAGLHCSFLIITDKALREQYLNAVSYAFLHYGGTFATSAMLAAYTHGQPWLHGVKQYVEKSLLYCKDFLEKRCAPEIVPLVPEATYLLWLDCQNLNVADPAEFLKLEAGVILSAGAEFGGASSAQFARLNVACRRPLLVEALNRIASAVERKRASASSS